MLLGGLQSPFRRHEGDSENDRRFTSDTADRVPHADILENSVWQIPTCKAAHDPQVLLALSGLIGIEESTSGCDKLTPTHGDWFPREIGPAFQNRQHPLSMAMLTSARCT